MAYNGTTEVASGLKPMGAGGFPLVNAADVYVTDEKRLDAALNEKANAADTIPKPEAAGTEGDVLRINSSGNPVWTDPAVPTDSQVREVVTDWLDENPTAIPTELGDQIDDLKSATKEINDRVGEVVQKSFTKPDSGNAVLNFAYPIQANKSLRFYWTAENGTPTNGLNLSTRETASGENIETLKTSAKLDTVYTVTPTQDANYLRIVATITGTIYVWDTGTLTDDVNQLKTDVEQIVDNTLTQSGKAADAKSTGDAISHIANSVGEATEKSFTKTGSSNATAWIPHTVTAGKPIIFYWMREGTANDSLNLFTRQSQNGENVDTLKLNAKPDKLYTCTPEHDAAGLYLSATASGTICVYDGGTVAGDIAEIKNDVSGLKTGTSNLEDNMDALSENVEALESEVAEIRENIEKTETIAPIYEGKRVILADGSISPAANNEARMYYISLADAIKITVTSARASAWTSKGPIIAFYSIDTGNYSDYNDSNCVLVGTTHLNTSETFTETYSIPEGARSALIQSTATYVSNNGDPTATISSISVLKDIQRLDAEIGQVQTVSFTKTGSSNATAWIPHTIRTGVPLMFIWNTQNNPSSSMNIFSRQSSSGSNTETVKNNALPGVYYTFVPTADAAGLYLSATASGTITVYDGETLHGDIADLQNEAKDLQKHKISTPFVQFSYSDIMYNPSAIFAESGEMGDISAWPNAGADALSKVHSAFDALIGNGGAGYGYGSRVYPQDGSQDGTKLYKESAGDAALFDLLAPSYVTAGVSQGETVTLNIGTDSSNNPVTYSYTYESATSPYDVRLYKFSDTNSALHAGNVDIPKKKILIIGGTHGNEFCAPINLYVLAKHLCTDYENPDVMKLRSAFDVYFIPYLNGFGCQYKWNNQGYTSVGSRSNGHLVDINRNCETFGWVGATGTAEQITAHFEAKIANLGTNTFAGSSNGSEFESKLLKAIIDWLHPNVVIDHHHNEGTNPYYTICYGTEVQNLVYQAGIDVAYAMHKNMASYYGTGYNLYFSSSVSPATKAAANGFVTTMAYEQGVIANATTEMSQSISYLNGVYDATTRQTTKFGSDVFKISEYSLLNVILHLGQYAMEH